MAPRFFSSASLCYTFFNATLRSCKVQLRQEFVVMDNGVCSQVLDSEKDLKVLKEEMAPLGATRESLRSQWKQEVQPEEPTFKGSQSSHQRPGEQSEGKQKPLSSPEAGEEQSFTGNKRLN